ncbi:sperm-associated antigen 17-like isoform X2 [Symsagittifera roscoffensis]|uniref:sperm-associated antigen 17-like isoform X2 n=1 Tax=Symsagittifera roscoffensis TaxID=84072 RepID=UPI00307C0D7B
MPPKRQKSGQGSAGPPGGGGGGGAAQQKWEAGLIAAPFNDDDWKAAVVLVIAGRPEDRKNAAILQEAVATGSRRLFSSIELAEMYKVANELGNPKQKKEKNTPPFFEVNELVKQYLDNNEPIPVQVMARLIKWHLLSIKSADLKRKEDEKKNADKSKGGPKAAAGGKKGDRQKSAAKGGGAAAKGDKAKGAADVPPAPRKDTKLRKRGEDDDDSKYIDDEPDDGPQHYVTIFGQSDALLVQALSDVGVYVDTVLGLKTDSYEGYDLKLNEGQGPPKPEEKFEEQLTKAQLALIATAKPEPSPQQTVTSKNANKTVAAGKQATDNNNQLPVPTGWQKNMSLLSVPASEYTGSGGTKGVTEENGGATGNAQIGASKIAANDYKSENEQEKAERDKLQSVFERFWQELPIVLKQAPSQSKIRDTVQLDQVVQFESIPPNVDLDLDERGSFGVDLFETTACILYDMFDWKRQYYNYLENTNFQNIPEVSHTVVDYVSMPATTAREDQSAPAKGQTGQSDKAEKQAGGAGGKKVVGPETPRKDGDGLDENQDADYDFLDLAHLDLSFYNDLLATVPSDCISVELTMHCMLEQIACSSAPSGSSVPAGQPKLPTRPDGLDASLAEHLSGLLLKLALNDDEKKAIEEKLASHTEAEKEKMETKLVNFKDNLSIRLHSLRSVHGFDPAASEEAMLSLTPSAALLNYPQPSIEEQQNIAGRFQEVMMHCAQGSMSQAEVNHALKQFIFECIQLKEPDENGLVLTSNEGGEQLLVPWDDPYPFSTTENAAEVIAAQERKISEADHSRPSSVGGANAQGGILKRSASAGSSKNASGYPPELGAQDKNDVIADADSGEKASDDDSANGNAGYDTTLQPPAITRSFSDLAENKLRNLDEWCYVERFERNVFIQVLEEAKYHLPLLEAYYCRKDNTLLLTLYNPTDQNQFNCQHSFSYLHTDIGFRNYLHYIKEKIEEWTEKEEQKYVQVLAEKERLAAMSPGTAAAEHAATEDANSAGGKGGKRSRSQSPKGGAGRKGSAPRSKSPKGGKETSAGDDSEEEREDPSAPKPFMRPNSMKQWKLEQDKVKEAEEKKRLEKEKGQAGAEKGAKGKASGKKGSGSPSGSREGSRSRSGSRGGGDSRSASKEKKGKKGSKGAAGDKKGQEEHPSGSEKQEVVPNDVIAEMVQKEFNGYNLGDNIVHYSGKTSGLFPCDGAQIRIEHSTFAEGSNQVLLTLLEGANVLNLHIGQPKDISDLEANQHEKETEVNEGITGAAEGDRQLVDSKTNLIGGGSLENSKVDASLSNLSDPSHSKSGPLALEESAHNLEISVSKASPTHGDKGEESMHVMMNGLAEGGGDDDCQQKDRRDPKDSGKEVNEYGSFSAKLSDGIALSFSCFGDNGLNPNIEMYLYDILHPNEEKAMKFVDMKAPVPPTPPAAEAKPDKGGSAKGKKGKGSAGKKGGKGGGGAEATTPPPGTPPGGDKQTDGGLGTRGTDATGLLGHEEAEMAAKKDLSTSEFQQLHVSSPNGLTVNFYLEKSVESGDSLHDELGHPSLLVEQSYPFKSNKSSKDSSESDSPLASSTAWKEKTRYVNSQGNVIKILNNGKIEVLCADGTRLEYSGPWVDPTSFQTHNQHNSHSARNNEEGSQSRPESQNSQTAGEDKNNSRPGTASKKTAAKSPNRGKSPKMGGPADASGTSPGAAGELQAPAGDGAGHHPTIKESELHERGIIGWNYVTGIGEQLITNSKGEREKTEDLKYYTATDPESMEVLMIREDRVMMVSRPDNNTLIVDHNDGTRITTFYKEQQMPTPPHPSDPTEQVEQNNDEHETASRLVRFVRIECEGFATLDFNTEDSSCNSFFGSQTSLFAHPTGLYVSSCADGSAIVISHKGQVVYVRKPDHEVIGYLCNCDSFDHLPPEVLRSNVFVLKHNDPNILQHTDSCGNFYAVDINGEVVVSKCETENAEPIDPATNQRVRYFVVNPDQSGEELLRHNDIVSLLRRAEDDPSIVVLVDPIPEQPNVKGVTVMQPSFSAKRDKWLIQKEEKNIIPKNLTSRDLKTLPPREFKKPGPKFGTRAGKGLNVGSLAKSKATEEVPIYPKMPDVVALRQFVGFPEVKPEVRSALTEGLKSYCQSVEERKLFVENSKKSDPRSKEEIERSVQLEKRMKERSGQQVTTIRVESESDQNPFNHPVLKERARTGSGRTKEGAVETYRVATKPPTPPEPLVAKPKRTNSAWGRDKEETRKEADNKEKLRNKHIPPYFQSYLAENFVHQQKELGINDDLKQATNNLPFYAEKKKQEILKRSEIETSQVIDESAADHDSRARDQTAAEASSEEGERKTRERTVGERRTRKDDG